MDLNSLIASPEGKTLEFKRDLASPSTFIRTAVAFSNTAGGTIVLGVSDRKRDVVGVSGPFELEERIANLLSDRVHPRILPEIDILRWRERAVVAVKVHPGPSRPYRLSGTEGPEGVFVRVGSTNRQADVALVRELARVAAGSSFDEEPLPELGVSDLDRGAISEALGREIGSRELRSLRLAARHGERLVPTVGGELLFGRSRRERFPDAWIMAGRFAGSDKTVLTDRQDITSGLVRALEESMAFVRRNVAVSVSLQGSVRRSDVWQYPLEAVREVLVNAVAHADYSQVGAVIRIAIHPDRLEIENPGLLVPGLTIEDIVTGVSRPRNRVIARVFREVGLMESWGTGIPRVRDLCRQAGLPEPSFEELERRFRVTLRASEDAARQLDPVDEAIVGAIAASPGMSTAEVARRIQRTPRAARNRLRTLADLGVVVEVGSSPNDPHRKYFVAETKGRYGRRRG